MLELDFLKVVAEHGEPIGFSRLAEYIHGSVLIGKLEMTGRHFDIEQLVTDSASKWQWTVYDGNGQRIALGFSSSEISAESDATRWIDANQGRESDPTRAKLFNDLMALSIDIADAGYKKDLEYFVRNAESLEDSELVYFLGSTLDNTRDVPDAEPRMEVALSSSFHSFLLLQLVDSNGKDDSTNLDKISSRYRYRAAARAFLSKYFLEIQIIICERQSGSDSASPAGKATGVGLATWLGSTLTLNNSLAAAVMTSIIVLIAAAGRGAFCKMDFETFWRSVEASSSTPEGDKRHNRSGPP